MKKTAIVLIAVLCMVMAVSLAACNGGGQLATPTNVTINGNVLSWDEVKNATEYMVEVNGKEVGKTTSTHYTYLTDVVGTYTLRVKAVGKDNFTDSAYSESVSFNVTTALTKPVISKTQEGNKITFSWKDYSDAAKVESYQLYIGLNFNDIKPIPVAKDVTSYTIDITEDQYDDIGRYQIKLIAKSGDDKFSDSLPSNILTFINTRVVATPSDFKWDNGNFKWESTDDKATKFKLMATDVNDAKNVFESETSGKVLNMSNLRIDKPGTYNVTVMAYYSAGDRTIYLDSAPAEAIKVTVLPGVDKDSIKISNESSNPNKKTISWSKVEGATGYTLIADTGKGTSFNIDIQEGTTTSFDLFTSNEFKKAGRAYKVFSFRIVAKGDQSDVSNLKFDSGQVAMNDGQYYQYLADEADYAVDALKDEKDKIFPKLITNEETKESYYEVKNFANLMWALHKANGTTIKLANNIDDISTTEFVSPCKDFKGTFDGNGYNISKIIMTQKFDRDSMSIFGNIAKGATIKNVVVSNLSVKLDDKGLMTGIIADINNGTISNVIVQGDITLFNNSDAAAVVYENRGTIDGAIANVNIQAQSTAGIAINNATNAIIKNSNVYGSIKGAGVSGKTVANAIVGGVVANNSGHITYVAGHAPVLVNTAELEDNTVKSTQLGIVGGIVGVNTKSGKIDYSYFTNGVTANCSNDNVISYAGGFVGKNEGAIVNSYVDSTSSLRRQNTTPIAGGFAGYNSGTISGVFSNITIPDSSNANKAAFVADNSKGTIMNVAYNLGRSGQAPMVLAGMEGTIDKETAKGFESNNIAASLSVLGDAYVIYDNFGKNNPVLKDVLYVTSTAIYSVERDIDLTRVGDYKKYYVGGKEYNVEGSMQTNKYSGYQIVKYTANVGEGDNTRLVVYNRLVQVK